MNASAVCSQSINCSQPGPYLVRQPQPLQLWVRRTPSGSAALAECSQSLHRHVSRLGNLAACGFLDRHSQVLLSNRSEKQKA